MPPVMVNVRPTARPSPRSKVTAPLPRAEGTLKENALGGPTCGWPSRLKRMRSMALASVAVPTVERALAPIRSWSTRMAVVRPSSTSTSGRSRRGMKPWTKALYVSFDQPLRLSGDGVEHERALAGAGDAGEHGQAAFGDLHADVLEVVDSRALHADQVMAVGGVRQGRAMVAGRGQVHARHANEAIRHRPFRSMPSRRRGDTAYRQTECTTERHSGSSGAWGPSPGEGACPPRSATRSPRSMLPQGPCTAGTVTRHHARRLRSRHARTRQPRAEGS